MMPGLQVEQITNAIASAYTKDTLEEMLRMRLDVRLDMIVEEKRFSSMVFDLFSAAEQEGWEVKLVREAYRYRSGNKGLLDIYERYGLAAEIDLQTAGAKAEAESTKASSAGFERTVNGLIPMLDIGLFRIRLTDFEMRVARIDIDGEAAGTGFLVGPQVVLTNYHVVQGIIKGGGSPASVSCTFDYKVLANGATSSSPPVRLGPKGILAHAPYSAAEAADEPDRELPAAGELDFALLHLERPVGSELSAGSGSPPRGWEVLPATPVTFTKGEGIIIVQHPAGLPMKVAVDSSGVTEVNANQTRVRYKTNTEPGSSGSLVLDMKCNFVALHHYGDPLHDKAKWNQGVIQLHKIRDLIAAAGAGEFLGKSV